MDNSYDPTYSLENDPLSKEVKARIRAFARPYLDTVLTLEADQRADARKLLTALRPAFSEDNRLQAENLAAEINKHLSPPSSVSQFQQVVRHPEQHLELLGIENKPAQIYTARIYLQSMMKARIQRPPENAADNPTHYRSPTFPPAKIPNPYYIPPLTDEVIAHAAAEKYKAELCAVDMNMGRSSPLISAKHQLLMQADPVQRLPASNPSPLDQVLVHTYFQTGRWMTQTYTEPNGTSKTKEFFQDREKYRALIHQAFSALAQDRRTRHIIEAFAAAAQKEGGNILISYSPLSTGSLGTRFGIKGLGTSGFYAQDNAVVSSGVVNPADETIDSHNMGTVVHEILHYMFDVIHNNKSVPIAYNDPEAAAALDKAIAADKAHRAKKLAAGLKPDKLPFIASKAWNTVTTDLEQEPEYWKGYKKTDDRTMRAEIIVRPMEQIAEAVVMASLLPKTSDREAMISQAVQAVQETQPNILDYYNKTCMPELKKYTQQAQREQQLIQSTAPASQRHAHTDGSARRA